MVKRDRSYLKEHALAYIDDSRPELRKDITDEQLFSYTDALIYEQNKKAERQTIVSAQPAQQFPQKTKKEAKKQVYCQKKDIYLQLPIDLDKFWISSFFGKRKNGNRYEFHSGVDMAALKGTPVKAAHQGRVIEARYVRGYGKTIVIAHDRKGKYKTRYAHLHKIMTKVGCKVSAGSVIGQVGNTGNVRSSKKGHDPSHLHFELIKFNRRINPLSYLLFS